MKNKTKKLATSNTSITDLPQFESIDITELQICKNQVVEDYYIPDNTEWEKRVYQRVIEKIEERMLEFSSTYYELNSKLPGGSKEIISYIPKPEIHNQDVIDIGIEAWNELELKIGFKEVTFQNRHTNKSVDRYLNKLKWEKNLKIAVLRIFGCEAILKHQHFIQDSKYAKTPTWQSIRNAIQNIKNTLRMLFPNLPDNPIAHNKKMKGHETSIKVTLLAGEEYLINMNEKLQRKALKDTGMTYEPEFDDDRKESAHYDHYEVFDEE